MMQRHVFLKRRADAFPVYLFQDLSFFYLQIIIAYAKLCYAFEEKFFFSLIIILWKKGHSKLSKNEPDNIP